MHSSDHAAILCAYLHRLHRDHLERLLQAREEILHADTHLETPDARTERCFSGN